jgi:pilus assembly protein CpaE
MTARVLIVDDSQLNLKLATAALKPAGYDIHTAEGGPEALSKIGDIRPMLIILDVTMPEMDGYELCRRLRKMPEYARAPIMMLTANDSLEERINGLEAGADDYMSKPFEPVELRARAMALLRRAVPEPSLEQKQEGRTYAVFSLRGGVGVTTIATNLAVGLSQVWGGNPLLIDLAFTGGQSALMLNLPLRTSWGQLAQRNPEDVDDSILEAVFLHHDSGVRVLASPTQLEHSELISPEVVSHVLKLSRQKAPAMILDMPHDFQETTLAGLDIADQILLVITPELAAVRGASNALAVFDQLDYLPTKTTLVLNYTFERGALARKDIETALRRPIDIVLPYAGETMVRAVNLGTPPIYEQPSRGIGAFFEDWAFFMVPEEQRQQRPEHPCEGWQRVAQRAQQRRSR